MTTKKIMWHITADGGLLLVLALALFTKGEQTGYAGLAYAAVILCWVVYSLLNQHKH